MKTKTLIVVALCALLSLVNAAASSYDGRSVTVKNAVFPHGIPSAVSRSSSSATPLLPHSSNSRKVPPNHAAKVTRTLAYSGDKCEKGTDHVSFSQRRTSCHYWLTDKQGNDWSCKDNKTVQCFGSDCPTVACMGAKGTAIA